MGWLKRLLTGGDKVMPVRVTDANFKDEVLGSELPVVLDVWGPSCAPCKRMEPIIMDLATRYKGRVKIAELNAAEFRKTAARVRVSGTPTVIYYRSKGREAERVVGFRGALYHIETIDEVLLEGAAS